MQGAIIGKSAATLTNYFTIYSTLKGSPSTNGLYSTSPVEFLTQSPSTFSPAPISAPFGKISAITTSPGLGPGLVFKFLSKSLDSGLGSPSGFFSSPGRKHLFLCWGGWVGQ